MLREVCGEYLTRTGKVGATIYRTTSGGQVTYSYIGTWGAGSGLSAADMRATVKEWSRTKRGARAAVPFGDRRRRAARGGLWTIDYRAGRVRRVAVVRAFSSGEALALLRRREGVVSDVEITPGHDVHGYTESRIISGNRHRRRAYGHSAQELVVRNEVTGAHHGQVDGRIIAYLGERAVGSLQWSEFRGETLIHMIRVSPELARRGVATKMYRTLKADTKGRIKWGMLTPEGRALYRTLKARREL
jgi:hypothetical protein